MKINNFQGDLTNTPTIKEALIRTISTSRLQISERVAPRQRNGSSTRAHWKWALVERKLRMAFQRPWQWAEQKQASPSVSRIWTVDWGRVWRTSTMAVWGALIERYQMVIGWTPTYHCRKTILQLTELWSAVRLLAGLFCKRYHYCLAKFSKPLVQRRK